MSPIRKGLLHFQTVRNHLFEIICVSLQYETSPHTLGVLPYSAQPLSENHSYFQTVYSKQIVKSKKKQQKTLLY